MHKNMLINTFSIDDDPDAVIIQEVDELDVISNIWRTSEDISVLRDFVVDTEYIRVFYVMKRNKNLDKTSQKTHVLIQVLNNEYTHIVFDAAKEIVKTLIYRGLSKRDIARHFYMNLSIKKIMKGMEINKMPDSIA